MVSAVIGEKPYKTELFASGHQLIADEPVEIGGGDEGPPPGQFLELSLASCTAITLRMYAIRKSLSLKNIRVEVQSERTSDHHFSYGNLPGRGNNRRAANAIASDCQSLSCT